MKILSLELVGYKRFVLNNIHQFVFNPRKPIQLIIGTNGSGKSSLLQELSPLPPAAYDFLSDGYKKIKIEHHGSVYELSSTFKSKQEHLFVKDGLSLNLQGTSSVQKELIKHEFNITPEIQSVISGQISLCSMSASDRRYWFTKLADTNYDYALSLYRRTQEKLRDVTGSLKIAKSRLVAETAKIVSKDEIELLVTEVNQLHETLQLLTEYRIPLDKTPYECEQLFIKAEYEITKIYHQLTKKKKNHESQGLSIIQVDEKLRVLESERTVQQLLINTYFEKHTSLEETIELLRQTGGEGSVDFKNKIASVNLLIESNNNKKTLGLVFDDVENAVTAFDTIEDSLSNVFSSLAVNTEGKYSKIRLAELSTKILSGKDRLEKIVTQLSGLEALKAHQEAHKNQEMTHCPSCSFKWFKGFIQAEYDYLCSKVENVRETIDELTVEIQEYTEEHQDILNYADTYRVFSNCCSNWPILRPIWNHILDQKILTNNPKSGNAFIKKLKLDFQIDLDTLSLIKQNVKTQELLEITQTLGQSDINKLIDECSVLEKNTQTCTAKIQSVDNEVKKLSSYKSDMTDIIDLSEQIDALMSSCNLLYSEHKEAFRRDALIDIIKATQSRLSKKEQLLHEIKTQSSIIADIQKQVDIQQIEESAYKSIAKELSPVEGLIAEGLLGFISSFVYDMNEFISKVWLYPLEVIACGLDADGSLELDYKFPLKIKDRVDNVPDINKGSSAMKEIVDLAFRITAIKYLGLEESPLLLDEFGKTFDKEHRLAAAYGIKELMEMKSFTQLFTVSHYEATYGSLTNAEICVLCSKNISIPTNAVYNEHVIIA